MERLEMIRFFDITLSAFALLLLVPIVLPVMLLLRVTGEGEIFYFQHRVGENGRLFRLIKFTTMLKNSPDIATGTVTIRNDPRVLPLGGILRKSKINELPQFLNVLLGQMSLIGPRPQTPTCFQRFPIKTQAVLSKMKPGLSGIGSIVFRGEERLLEEKPSTIDFYNEVLVPYKGEVEEWYVGNKSIKNYFLLIFMTIFIVVYPRSRFVWRMFKDLPRPPESLRAPLGYDGH